MKDYLNKTSADLVSLLAEKRGALRSFRFGSSGGKEKDVKAGRNLRGEIARIMTALSQKVEAEKAEAK